MVSMLTDLLTVLYLYSPTDDPDWHQDFLNCFDGTGIVPMQYPGIAGDLQQARINAYKTVNTPYVVMVDPDDLVNPSAFLAGVEFLEANPSYGACALREELMYADGGFITRQPFTPVTPASVRRSPADIHSTTVFRTVDILAMLDALGQLKFQNFDWALRLCLVHRRPIHRLDLIGGKYRRHNRGHRSVRKPTGHIPNWQTYTALVEAGLINSDEHDQ